MPFGLNKDLQCCWTAIYNTYFYSPPPHCIRFDEGFSGCFVVRFEQNIVALDSSVGVLPLRSQGMLGNLHTKNMVYKNKLSQRFNGF